MNKNTVIGFVLIGVIMFGFTWYQSKEYEKQVKWQAQQDSIALAQKIKADSIWLAEHPEDTLALQAAPSEVAAVAQPQAVYRDSLVAAAYNAEPQIVRLSNGKVDISFTTKGAQPYTVILPEYKNYDSTALCLFKPEGSEMSYSIYVGENVRTKDLNFTIEEQTDSTVSMVLPFAKGGFIRQMWKLRKDSYVVDNVLSFVGMDSSIPRNVASLDFDWKVTVPRMEKGYRNETQYSKLDYYFADEKKPEEIGRGRSASKKIDNKLSWIAFQQQFFSSIIRSKSEFGSGNVSIEFKPEDNPDHNLMTCSANMRSDFRIDREVNYENEFYFGPNHYQTLKAFDQKYEKIIPLGGWVVGWFTKYVIIPLFNWLHRFISNFGLIILLMTVFIKLVVFPFAFKSLSSSSKMQVIKPEVDKLNEKYPKPEDAMKKQQAMMALYQRAGISPMGGCLPMLLQFPILWAMFRFFPASIELRQQSFLWADDLSAYDSIIDFGTNIPLLGNHISLFALLMAVSMFLYSKIVTGSQMSGNDPNAAVMRFMSIWMMPIMMFFICNNLSSGLSYYYLLSNLITMLETFIIKKFFIHPEEIQRKLRESAGKPAPKSKWQQRLEEIQKQQAAMAKQQAANNRRR